MFSSTRPWASTGTCTAPTSQLTCEVTTIAAEVAARALRYLPHDGRHGQASLLPDALPSPPARRNEVHGSEPGSQVSALSSTTAAEGSAQPYARRSTAHKPNLAWPDPRTIVSATFCAESGEVSGT